MNATTELERTLATWLEHEGPDDVPERVVEAALDESRTVRQRPPWLTSTWWASRESRATKGTLSTDRVPTLPVIRPPLRLGWVVVVIAALLALLGALFVVGALQNETTPLLSVCPVGTNPNEPGPIDQKRPPRTRGISASAVWDRDRGVIVLANRGTWRFDVCTNTWNFTATHRARADVSAVVYDVDSRLVVSFGGPTHDVWSYDPALERSADRRRPPTGHILAAYDPMTGLAVVTNLASELRPWDPGIVAAVWTYDVDTDVWTKIMEGGMAPPYSRGGALLEYDGSVDRFILLQSPGATSTRWTTWELDVRSRRWSQVDAAEPRSERRGCDAAGSDTCAPLLGFGWFGPRDEVVYDDANARTLVLSDDGVAAYDAGRDRWELVYEDDLLRAEATVAYDPLNDRMILFGGERQARYSDPDSWHWTDDVAAFDYQTRTWTELLAPSE